MKSLCVVAAFCCVLTIHAQVPLRLCGSTTVKSALEPRQATLEAAVGRPIEFSGNGTAAGLLSLAAGNADVGMLSLPLEEVAENVNRRTPGCVDPKQYRAERIGTARTLFIVNPHNGVRALRTGQLAEVLAGRIANWKEVGGIDAPIVVVSLGNGGSLLDPLMHGQNITPRARIVSSAMQIPVIVAQDPNAIGIISAAHPRGPTTVLQTDTDIEAPLFLVTKGEPAGLALKLVQTARKLLDQPALASATRAN
jgi:phosphate transport system substrate-binding protein